MPYCTQCGKKLEEGEICTCQQTTEDHPEEETKVFHTPNEADLDGNYFTEESVSSEQQSDYEQNSYQQENYPPADYQQNGYQQNGYQHGGYQQNGYQQSGYQQNGYQQNGYQQGGYQQNGYQQNGYQQGYHQGGSQQAEWLNQKAGQFAAGTKNMFAEILPVLKHPVSRVRQITAADNASVGIEFIVAKMIAFILIAILVIVRVRSELGYMSQYVEIPVFRIFSLIIILTAGIDFLEALLLKAFSGITHGSASFSGTLITVGVKDLYETLIVLACGLVALAFPMFGIVLGSVLYMIVPYMEYHAYVAAVPGDDDRKAYAYFLVKVCMMLILLLLLVLLAGDIMSGIAGNSVGNILDDLL